MQQTAVSQKEKPGLRLERQVIEELHRQGATVEVSHGADHNDKIDYKIPAIHGQLLAKPLESQLTTNVEDEEKLRQFLKILFREQPTIFFYTQVEVRESITPAYIASCTIEQTLKLQGLLQRICIYAMHISVGEDGNECHLMRPEERLKEMARNKQEEARKYQRLQGFVHSVGQRFILLRALKNDKFFKAYWSDVLDWPIKSQLFELGMLEHGDEK